MRIVVDGYNLIRQSDTLKRIDKLSIEAGRRELIKRLARYARHRGHRVTVVFDGWMAGSPIEEREVMSGITVIYSKRGEKADEVIKRLVRQTGEETVVVTSDREVAGAVSRAGAVAVPAPIFEARLDETRPVEEAGDDIAIDDDGDTIRHDTKKRGPARRISRKKRLAATKIKKL
ncbi:MAG TPA: NYN domain-containing protein [Syntrophales bacterium]|nr:NYN domain-containing protein [Syntrophales bacterium]HRT71104.1 NYN domain-containing protein [Syntrophales bacterium]